MKYVLNFDPATAGRSLGGEFDPSPDAPSALYDLAKDPGEREDVAATHPGTVRRLRHALLAHLGSFM